MLEPKSAFGEDSITMREITSRLESFYIDVPALRPGTIGAYLLAFVSVGVATVLRLAIDPYVGGLQFATFLPAVIITTLISGLGAGLFSVVLSLTATAFFVLPPRFSLYVEEPADVLAIVLYMVAMLFNVAVITGMRVAVERERDKSALQRQADLLDQSHDAILTMQTVGRSIVYWSRGAERLYGYKAAEAQGRRAQELLHTRAPVPIEDIDAQIVDEGSWAGELTHTTRDGRDIVVESHIVHASYRGETLALETNHDITERKRAEEQLRLLMREMNHRAKNLLSVVDAIAHQTATRNPDDFIERFSERIQALSANQELLFRNEWKGVEIESLVRAQLAHFADLIGPRIALQGPMQRLNPVGAQAIGLALHELATNAGKYGALSTEAGRVDIRWATEGETCTMSWTEHGGPPVSPPRGRGFGTVVMKEMAERNVNGTVDLEYAPSGVTWRLTCPAVNALEPQ